MCAKILFGTRSLMLVLSILIAASSSAQENKAPVEEHFPLDVKLLGFIVTNNSNAVMLEIERQTIVLQQGERKNVEFTSLTQVKDGEKNVVVNLYKCQLMYEANSLDVVNKKLRLTLGNYLSIDCPLGKAVRSGKSESTGSEAGETDEPHAEIGGSHSNRKPSVLEAIFPKRF